MVVLNQTTTLHSTAGTHLPTPEGWKAELALALNSKNDPGVCLLRKWAKPKCQIDKSLGL